MSSMAGAHDIETLRWRMEAVAEARPEYPRAVLSLGEAALDAGLPGHGLPLGAVHELCAASHGDFPASLGFGFGLLSRLAHVRPGSILYAVPARAASEGGLVYPPGLAAFGLDPQRVLHVNADKPRDVLWALEEGLSSPALAAAVGILPANESSYDFTASRRLSMRAAENGVTGFLLRHREMDVATAAATRWSIAAGTSTPVRYKGLSMPGLGPPRWEVRLIRSKGGRPNQWLVEWDHEALSFRLAAALADRAPAPAFPDIVRDRWAAAS